MSLVVVPNNIAQNCVCNVNALNSWWKNDWKWNISKYSIFVNTFLRKLILKVFYRSSNWNNSFQIILCIQIWYFKWKKISLIYDSNSLIFYVSNTKSGCPIFLFKPHQSIFLIMLLREDSKKKIKIFLNILFLWWQTIQICSKVNTFKSNQAHILLSHTKKQLAICMTITKYLKYPTSGICRIRIQFCFT